MPSRSTLRTLARIHAWTGLVLCVPLLVIALSGIVLLFKDTLLVPADWKSAPPSHATVDAEVVRLLARPAIESAASIAVARGERAFHVVERTDGSVEHWRFGADAASQDVPARLHAERWVLELHEHLQLGTGGDVLVRIVGPVATALIVVGAVLWWPLRRGWRARDLVPRGAGRPELLRSHVALGAAAGLLLFVHAGSGALMANNPAIRGWLRPHTPAAATALPPGAPHGFPSGDPHGSRPGDPHGFPPGDSHGVRPGDPHGFRPGDPHGFRPGDPHAAVAAVRTLYPHGEVTLLSPNATDGGITWTLRLRLPGERHPNGRSNVMLDLSRGVITAVRDARLAGVAGAYDDIVFPLHVGTLFGPAQRWVWLAGATGFALLTVLGVVAFVRRPRGRSE